MNNILFNLKNDMTEDDKRRERAKYEYAYENTLQIDYAKSLIFNGYFWDIVTNLNCGFRDMLRYAYATKDGPSEISANSVKYIYENKPYCGMYVQRFHKYFEICQAYLYCFYCYYHPEKNDDWCKYIDEDTRRNMLYCYVWDRPD